MRRTAALRIGLLASLRTPSLCSVSASMHTANRIQIEQIKCLSDNYGFLLHVPEAGLTACIDTPEVAPIVAACERRGWSLTHIWNTHHHFDHAGGNTELKERFGCTVMGPRAEMTKIPTIDKALSGGDTFIFGEHEISVIDVGGHTLGQIAYHVPDANAVFVGDALFALGCGRLFEGTAAQAWASLMRLASLPAETYVFCAHEYTEANLRFALTVEPANLALQKRAQAIRALRAEGKPTVPTTIGLELETNPFLRPSSPSLRTHIGVPDDESAEATFSRLRTMKDNF